MDERRPLKIRVARWPGRLARFLVCRGVTPNQVSLLSVAFAAAGAAGLAWGGPVGLGVAIAGIQLRLLCNLLDGLMAVEEGQGGPLGALYNDVPDRFADAVLLVAAGFAAGLPALGWLAALVAVLVAYGRFVGASLTGSHDFRGPAAKQHRMFALTVGCGLALMPGVAPFSLGGALVLIVVGGLATFARRMGTLAHTLEAS